MLDPAALFGELLAGMSAVLGGPYHAGKVVDQVDVELDEGGSISDSAEPTERDCMVQVDAATWSMRHAEGFVEGDVRFIILASSLAGSLDTDAQVEVLAGDSVPADFVGMWMVSGIERDPVGVGYVGRGRRA